jgi:hypothetical protein
MIFEAKQRKPGRFAASARQMPSRLICDARQKMKHPISLLLIALLSSTTGCILVPSPYSVDLKPVLARYSEIRTGALRAEIEAQLGASARVEEDGGACVWEVRMDDRNYAVAKIWFDAGDRAQKVEVTHAHGKISPGFDALAVTTRAQ